MFHLRQWNLNCGLEIHLSNWDKDRFVYMDLDYLVNNRKWCPHFSSLSQDKEAINFWHSIILRNALRRNQLMMRETRAEAMVGSTRYSTNRRRNCYLILNIWRRDRYLILNKLASRSTCWINTILNESSSETWSILNLASGACSVWIYTILKELMTQLLFHTQQIVGDSIDVW